MGPFLVGIGLAGGGGGSYRFYYTYSNKQPQGAALVAPGPMFGALFNDSSNKNRDESQAEDRP